MLSEEEIKMLEEYVQEFNENKKKDKLAYSTGFGKFWSNFVKAIENLINRNKQLEEIEKEHKKENGELRERIKEFEEKAYKKEYYEEVAEELYKNSIPKSKVREKIEELKEDIQYSANPLSIDNSKFGIYLLESILQEGDDK